MLLLVSTNIGLFCCLSKSEVARLWLSQARAIHGDGCTFSVQDALIWLPLSIPCFIAWRRKTRPLSRTWSPDRSNISNFLSYTSFAAGWKIFLKGDYKDGSIMQRGIEFATRLLIQHRAEDFEAPLYCAAQHHQNLMHWNQSLQRNCSCSRSALIVPSRT